jgi:hypothetical protein
MFVVSASVSASTQSGSRDPQSAQVIPPVNTRGTPTTQAPSLCRQARGPDRLLIELLGPEPASSHLPDRTVVR